MCIFLNKLNEFNHSHLSRKTYKMKIKFLFIIIFALFCFQFTIGQITNIDTVVVQAITFEDPSPEGWNASYKKIVHFPEESQNWAKIIMVQTLKCDSSTKGDQYPCGEWDYIWDTMIKVPKGDTTETFSIGSFVTPYGKRLWLGGEKGWQWTYDVTDYAPILTGKREIVTGNNQELLDLKFLFIKGTPIRTVLKVENIYPYGLYKYEHLADDSLFRETKLILSKEAKGFRLKARISGHGHAGPRNCCEWDSKTHSYYINKWEVYRWNVWKDCGNNPIYPQGGTWPFDRAGWCPGTKVDEYEFELTPKVNPGDTITIDYGIEPYQDNGEKDGEFRMSHQLFSYGAPNFKNDVSLVGIIAPSEKDEYSRINPICGNPLILIQNTGAFNLKSAVIRFGVAGKKMSEFKWIGTLEFLEEEEVVLPGTDWNGLDDDSKFVVELSKPNNVQDENPINNTLSSGIKQPLILPGEFTLRIKTNNVGRAKENSFTISNDAGTVFYSQDTFEDSTEYNIPIKLENGCYQFRFLDDMEDGISIHWWYRKSNPELVGINGEVSFVSKKGEVLHQFKPDFGQELLLNFRVMENLPGF